MLDFTVFLKYNNGEQPIIDLSSATSPNAVSRPVFIHDQQISRLTLEPGDHGDKLMFLRSRSMDDSRWIRVGDRMAVLSEFGTGDRVLLALTSDAGIGKSVFLEQLEVWLPDKDPSLVTLRVRFSDLPNDWQQYLRAKLPNHDDPFLVKRLFDEISSSPKLDVNLPMIDKAELYPWIEAVVRNGLFVLIIDGLDEYNGDDTRTKAIELRRVLFDVYPRLHCVIAGRPHAITDAFWETLLSQQADVGRRDHSEYRASEWDFLSIQTFDKSQRERFLGKQLATQFQSLGSEIDLTPRSLDALRTLNPKTIGSIRSIADLYWQCILESLPADNRPGLPNRLLHSELKNNEILHILSAIAITMALWHDDPIFDPPNPNPKLSPGLTEISTESHSIDEFHRRLFFRLCEIYPEWKQHDLITKRKFVEHWYQELIKLNAQYVKFQFFDDSQTKKIRWANASMRDFFAALWMATRSGPTEQAAFHQRSFTAKEKRDSSMAECWRMLCGMPESVSRLSGGKTIFEQNLPWLNMVKPLYSPPEGQNRNHGRPTELMYLAWPGLLHRAGFLSNSNWSEEDLFLATCAAQRSIDPKNRLSARDENASDVIRSFLSQYITLRDRSDASAEIIFEDLENCWRDCSSKAGMTVRVGNQQEKSNQEHDETLTCAFSIGAVPVTNRLYRLFDSFHQERFSDYQQYSPDPRCPAIYIDWYDAMMLSIWCHGYLPSEWEWEHASRAGCKNSKGVNAIYYWGDDRRQLEQHAWVKTISNDSTHPVGQKPPNLFGLYDTLGNVSQWCRTRVQGFARDNFERRRLRGGSFAYETNHVRCSFQDSYRPHFASKQIGCRIVRSQ